MVKSPSGAEVRSPMTHQLYSRLNPPSHPAQHTHVDYTVVKSYTYTPRKPLRRVLDHSLDHLNQIDRPRPGPYGRVGGMPRIVSFVITRYLRRGSPSRARRSLQLRSTVQMLGALVALVLLLGACGQQLGGILFSGSKVLGASKPDMSEHRPDDWECKRQVSTWYLLGLQSNPDPRRLGQWRRAARSSTRRAWSRLHRAELRRGLAAAAPVGPAQL